MLRRVVTKVLLLAGVWTCCACESNALSGGNIHLLEKYDFEKGSYAIVGMAWSDQGNKIQNELGDFYTDDIAMLQELKKEWVTGEASPIYACGYHYVIYVLKEGKELESFSINLDNECNTVATDRGHYYFDPGKVKALIGRVKKPVAERKTFKTLGEGRSYFKSLSGRTDVVMAVTPNWLDYDGDFRFYIDCDFGDVNSDAMQQCVDRLDKQIAAKYPGEKYQVEQAGLTISGSSIRKVLVRMKSTKRLYDRFDLYSVEWEWSGYTPDLIVLWKKAAK